MKLILIFTLFVSVSFVSSRPGLNVAGLRALGAGAGGAGADGAGGGAKAGGKNGAGAGAGGAGAGAGGAGKAGAGGAGKAGAGGAGKAGAGGAGKAGAGGKGAGNAAVQAANKVLQPVAKALYKQDGIISAAALQAQADELTTGCAAQAAMCCWSMSGANGQGLGNPGDNTDVCVANGLNTQGNAEGAIHCHGFVMANKDNTKDTAALLNYVNNKDHVTARKYFGDVGVNAVECSCVSATAKLPIVSRSDCTEITANGKFQACKGAGGKNNDLAAKIVKTFGAAKLKEIQAFNLVGNCNNINATAKAKATANAAEAKKNGIANANQQARLNIASNLEKAQAAKQAAVKAALAG
jgi:hypothetical protein